MNNYVAKYKYKGESIELFVINDINDDFSFSNYKKIPFWVISSVYRDENGKPYFNEIYFNESRHLNYLNPGDALLHRNGNTYLISHSELDNFIKKLDNSSKV